MTKGDTLWADVVNNREMYIKKTTKFCITCGKKLKKNRPDYFTKWCCTACALKKDTESTK